MQISGSDDEQSEFQLSNFSFQLYSSPMDFVIIANAWTAAADNPTGKHQIALQLAAKGHRVLWIEGSGMRKPSGSSSADRSRIAGKLKAAAKGIQKAQPNIWRTAPLIIPMPTRPLVRAMNAIIYVLVGALGAICLGFKRPTLINFLPVVPLAEKLWPWKKVYFCVDRWDKFDMYDTTVMSHVDDACCHNADVVLTTSHDLQTRCSPKNPNTTLIGHGVNWDHFAAPLHANKGQHPASQSVARDCISQPGEARNAYSRPSDGLRRTTSRHTGEEVFPPEAGCEMQSRATPRPPDMPDGQIVGFFGLLSEWVDQDLLISLARSLTSSSHISPADDEHVPHPTSHVPHSPSLVLIGKADVDISRLEAEPNIHILGPKPFSELPSYTAFFDVAIIPFIINELTIAVNPIKLREMLAAGCPVVSTALPEVDFVAQQTDYAETVATAEAFIAAVLKRLDEPATHEHRVAISDTMRTETWSAKVDQILEVISEV